TILELGRAVWVGDSTPIVGDAIDMRADYRGFDGKGWLCDMCAQPIVRAEDGCVQLVEVQQPAEDDADVPVARELWVVHRLTPGRDRTCSHQSKSACTFPLVDCLEARGLEQL